MKRKQTDDYKRGYQAGYAAAMKRRLVNGKPLGKPQRAEPIYRCAKCGTDSPSSEGDRCPQCGSSKITGDVPPKPDTKEPI
jgi:DNA-directed RNA polymerase subunit RPC12/RpoP